MGVLSDDIMQETPEFLTYLAATTFDRDPTLDNAKIINDICKANFEKHNKRLCWKKDAYIAVGAFKQYKVIKGERTEGWQPACILARDYHISEYNTRCLTWLRKSGQRERTRGWKLKIRSQDSPVLSSAFPYSQLHIYRLTKEQFETICSLMGGMAEVEGQIIL